MFTKTSLFNHNVPGNTNNIGYLPSTPVNARDMAGTGRDKAGTNRDKQGQARIAPFCPCLSLLVLVCPCLSLLVLVRPCLSRSVPFCLCLSPIVPVCPCRSLQMIISVFMSINIVTLTLFSKATVPMHANLMLNHFSFSLLQVLIYHR